MAIKMIAVDMDGTFLDDEKQYNRTRFTKLYQQLKEKDIKFVVASGNQYYQLVTFFPEIADEISFVGDNGAFVVSEGKKLFAGELAHDQIAKVLDIMNEYPEADYAVCGEKNAYLPMDATDEFYEYTNMYYYRLKRVPDMYDIDDRLYKVAATFPVEIVFDALTELQGRVSHIMTPVSSGHGDIDMIIPGLHKASGLERLQAKWGIKASEIMTFGDSGNDVEMLRHAGFGVSMANAADSARAAANLTTDSNNEEGVLNMIEKVLSGEFGD